MRRVSNERLGLTLDQVRVLSEGAYKPGTAYSPGDHIQWVCGSCTYKVEFAATESGYLDTWPDELVVHMWRAGHYTIESGKPIPAYTEAQPWERKALIMLSGVMVGFILTLILLKILN
jgi:hypothetical protein